VPPPFLSPPFSKGLSWSFLPLLPFFHRKSPLFLPISSEVGEPFPPFFGGRPLFLLFFSFAPRLASVFPHSRGRKSRSFSPPFSPRGIVSGTPPPPFPFLWRLSKFMAGSSLLQYRMQSWRALFLFFCRWRKSLFFLLPLFRENFGGFLFKPICGRTGETRFFFPLHEKGEPPPPSPFPFSPRRQGNTSPSPARVRTGGRPFEFPPFSFTSSAFFPYFKGKLVTSFFLRPNDFRLGNIGRSAAFFPYGPFFSFSPFSHGARGYGSFSP